MGVVTDSGAPLIDKKILEAFEKLERFTITNVNKPHEIGVFVDPNVSSTEGSCEMAIGSIARINGRLVVRFPLSLFLFDRSSVVSWHELLQLRVCAHLHVARLSHARVVCEARLDGVRRRHGHAHRDRHLAALAAHKGHQPVYQRRLCVAVGTAAKALHFAHQNLRTSERAHRRTCLPRSSNSRGWRHP